MMRLTSAGDGKFYSVQVASDEHREVRLHNTHGYGSTVSVVVDGRVMAVARYLWHEETKAQAWFDALVALAVGGEANSQA